LQKLSSLPEYIRCPDSSAKQTVLTSDCNKKRHIRYDPLPCSQIKVRLDSMYYNDCKFYKDKGKGRVFSGSKFGCLPKIPNSIPKWTMTSFDWFRGKYLNLVSVIIQILSSQPTFNHYPRIFQFYC
ncbi:hypothetical protein V8G54_032345, partial [Vigna mungo]